MILVTHKKLRCHAYHAWESQLVIRRLACCRLLWPAQNAWALLGKGKGICLHAHVTEVSTGKERLVVPMLLQPRRVVARRQAGTCLGAAWLVCVCEGCVCRQ